MYKSRPDMSRSRANFLLTEVDQSSTAAFSGVIEGLKRSSKRIPCKYFYDSEGSRLFDLICNLPEYYLTRTETAILQCNIDSILGRMGNSLRIIEPGAGSCLKARVFFENGNISSFMPLDVSTEYLREAAMRTAEDFSGLFVHAVSMDITGGMDRVEPFLPDSGRRVLFFPGSSIGNFDPPAAQRLLVQFGRLLRGGDMLLIGYDLIKDPYVLTLAYDDPQGITARFNTNVLARLNRELDANFDLGTFRHVALYNKKYARIEMYLESRIAQEVRISGHTIRLKRFERIHTENSYKYSISTFDQMAAGAGFSSVGKWTDKAQYFAVSLYKNTRQAMTNVRMLHA